MHRKERKSAKKAAKKEEVAEPAAQIFKQKEEEPAKEVPQEVEMKEEPQKLPEVTLPSSVVTSIDYSKLIDVLLIAKNDSKIRAGAEAIVRGLWNTADGDLKQKLKRKLISKLSSIKQSGQNSSRYLNTISFIFKSEE